MTNLLVSIAVLVSLLFLPILWRLTLSLLCSIFQFYTIPFNGFYPSLALLSTLSLTPNLLQFRHTFLQWPILFLILLMALQALSLLWSPDQHLGIATILYETPFVILFIIAFNIALSDPAKLRKLVKAYAVLSLAPLTFVIIFFFNHALNQHFLESRIATILINPNALAEYLAVPGHGEWNGKPNGFFINPNVGGAYLGICALLLWGMGSYYRTNWLKVIAILHWATLFLIMSFAAAGLAIFIPLLIVSIFITLEKKYLFGVKPSILLVRLWASIGLMVTLILFIKPKALSVVLLKLKSRIIFWKVAATFLPNHVLLGLGFGGWAANYDKFRALHHSPLPASYLHLLDPGLPPHNSLIILWSQSGLFASLLGLFFFISLLWFCFRALNVFTQTRERLFALCVTGGVLWVILQGMCENWGVIGEIHIQPILAVSLGLMMGLYHRKLDHNPMSLA